MVPFRVPIVASHLRGGTTTMETGTSTGSRFQKLNKSKRDIVADYINGVRRNAEPVLTMV